MPPHRDGAVRHELGTEAPWGAAVGACLAFAPGGDLHVRSGSAQLYVLQGRPGWAARLAFSAAVRPCCARVSGTRRFYNDRLDH